MPRRLDAAYLSSLYLETASDKTIDAFLKKNTLYDFKKKHWKPIHEVCIVKKRDWAKKMEPSRKSSPVS
jgi:hypothetical protein